MSPDVLRDGAPALAIATPEAGAIDVWVIRLDVSADVAARLAVVLDDEERARMRRLHGELLRTRFAVAHAAVRQILGECLCRPPQAVTFTSDAHGKPAVSGRPLAFNLSHSGDLAACAVAARGRLGVDVEVVRPVPDAERLVSRYCSSEEATRFSQVPAPERLQAFFGVWTRKEAFLKATGEGMARPLDSFAVSVGPGRPRLTRGGVGQWSMRSFAPWPGYVGTLAYDRPIAAVRRRLWNS